MVDAGSFKNGITIQYENGIWQVIEFQHVKPGKGAAFVRTKLKNIKSGGVVEKTFRPTEKCPQARIDRKDMQYLYSDEELNRYRKKHTGKFTIQRYKGLGEMDADQLYETTMNPESRVLKQVSINSIVEANKLTQTLMGTEVAPRREYIETHSTDAVLDI